MMHKQFWGPFCSTLIGCATVSVLFGAEYYFFGALFGFANAVYLAFRGHR